MPADPEFRFGGFRLPQYTQTPNEFFDVLAPKLTEAELRVLIYVIRRTFGFHKSADAISVSQMVSGITNAQGEIIDHGTGMSKSAVWRGTKGLLEKGVLQVARLQNPDGEYETNIYSLRFAEEEGVTLQKTNPYSPKEPGVSLPESRQNIDDQKKDEKDTSNLRRAPIDFEKYDDTRLALLPIVEDFARELNDQAPLASTVTRVVNLFRQSDLELDDFIDRMYTARAITQERTASIRGRSEGFGAKPKAAYFLSVLADITSRESA